MSRKTLAQLSGVGYSTIAEIENGRMHTSTRVHALAEVLNVRDTWLATGKGPRERAIASGTPPRTAEASPETMDALLERLGERLRASDPRTRELVGQMLLRYAEEPEDAAHIVKGIKALLGED